jgi:hypothetical protein
MYTNWEDNSMYVIGTLKWYSVTSVVEYLHELRQFIIDTPGKYGASYLPRLEEIAAAEIGFTVVDGILEEEGSRSHNAPICKDRSDSLGSHNLPASKDSRFPSDSSYICEAIGDWSLRLDKLALAANVMVNTNRLERKYRDFDTAGDVELYAIVSINQLLQMIHDHVSFINRDVFEQRYGLQWLENEEGMMQAEDEQEELNKEEHVEDNQALKNNNDMDQSVNQDENGRGINYNNDTDHNMGDKSDSSSKLAHSIDNEDL